jgi:hypothetical protein
MQDSSSTTIGRIVYNNRIWITIKNSKKTVKMLIPKLPIDDDITISCFFEVLFPENYKYHNNFSDAVFKIRNNVVPDTQPINSYIREQEKDQIPNPRFFDIALWREKGQAYMTPCSSTLFCQIDLYVKTEDGTDVLSPKDILYDETLSLFQYYTFDNDAVLD